MNIPEILFYSFTFILVGSAFGVVFHRNPVKSAMFLVLFFVGLAAMYALIGAEFMATLQVLVYVGAIMVLFLFVIMLISVREEALLNMGGNAGRTVIIAVLVLAFSLQFWVLLGGFMKSQGEHVVNGAAPYSTEVMNYTTGEKLLIKGNAEVISYTLFEKYLLPFELISLVLLVAVLGGILLTKHKRETLQ